MGCAAVKGSAPSLRLALEFRRVEDDLAPAAQRATPKQSLLKDRKWPRAVTRGDEDCHVILRGGKAPNFDETKVTATCAVLRAAGLRQQVMIDISLGIAASATNGKSRSRTMLRNVSHGRTADLRPDDREPPEGWPAGPRAGRTPEAWRIDHGRLYRLRSDRSGATYVGRCSSCAPTRDVTGTTKVCIAVQAGLSLAVKANFTK